MRSLRTLALVALLLVTAAAGPGTAVASTDAAQSDCGFPYTVTDATGTEVTVAEAPETVATLQPSDAQTMWEIGARDQVVAMPQNQYTGYLNDTDGRTNVANADGTTNTEAVVGANPDLVLAANVTRSSTIQQLRDAGLTVYHFPLVDSIDGVFEQTETIGRLTGNCEGASDTVSGMRDRVQAVQNTVADREQPRVLYYSYGWTTGNGSHINDLMETAGGQNIAAEAGLSGYSEISSEIVADRNPQWIVLQTGAPAPSGAPYNETAAMQEDQVLRVNANYLSQPAPRTVIALETMAEAFHPAAFEQTETQTATETDTTETTSADTQTTTTTSAAMADGGTATPTEDDHEHTTTSTNGSGPGFGLLAPLAALGGAALLAGRRKGT